MNSDRGNISHTRSNRKPLVIAFIIAAILSAIAYAFIFWNPGDRWIEEPPEVIPWPIVAPR